MVRGGPALARGAPEGYGAPPFPFVRRSSPLPHGAPSPTLRRRRLFPAAVLLLLTVAACAGPKRIVAFGDVHGDLEATRQALRLAGAIDEEDRWIGGSMVVVQTGDQLDRGDDEQAILDLFDRLRREAAEAGGGFHALLGNHEIMNVEGDLRYVTEGGFLDFAHVVEVDPDDPVLALFEPHERARMAAFLPGRPYALVLARRDVIYQVDGNVFVHGGVLPVHVAYGIGRLNQEARAWLRGEAELPDILVGPDSPHWTRLYSQEPDSVACQTLSEVLDALRAKRMIMGHTVQRGGITQACGGQAWLLDVGLAARYGGPSQVLEIVGDSVRVLGRD